MTITAHPKRKLLVTLVLAAATVGASAPPAPAAPLRGDTFQTPSGNIFCRLQHEPTRVLRCDILSGLNPEPRRDCDLDWVGLLLRSHNQARPNCAGDTIADRDAPVLRYGRRWVAHRLTCISRRSGLHCLNASGYHFRLARDDWDRWYTP